ncbi:MAG: NUDIX domain-containing protein [Elioraea tepidiphila]
MATPAISDAGAYGGVLLRPGPTLLLREVAKHFDRTVWTFPKGNSDPGETPEATALRDVLEETGYHGRIIGVLPGRFAGRTAPTAYFVMEPAGEPGPFGDETWQVCWASPEEAAALIALTPNPVARSRDLAVLAAALAWAAAR